MSRIEDLEKRLSADPNSKIFVQLAEEYRKAGLPEDAIATCRDGLEKHPNYFSARVALGRALLEINALEEARAEFEKVLKADPAHRNALYNRGIALLQMGRGRDAIAAWEELLKRYPADPQLQGLRARIEQVRATAGK